MNRSEINSSYMSFPKRFAEKTAKLDKLDAVLSTVSETLDEIRGDTGVLRTGLVSGKIRAEDPYRELLNRRNIQEHTERIRTILNGKVIVINFGDIFGEQNDLYKRVTAGLSPEQRGKALCDFCVEFVRTEVTDLFLLPGWTTSAGAKLEEEATLAKEGIIFYPENLHDLIAPRINPATNI